MTTTLHGHVNHVKVTFAACRAKADLHFSVVFQDLEYWSAQGIEHVTSHSAVKCSTK